MKVFNTVVAMALDEGLIRTEEINNTIKILRKSYPDSRIYPGGDMEHIEITLLTDNLDRSKIESFLKLVNNLGWYPSAYYANSPIPKKFTTDSFLHDAQNVRRVDLKIERKYDPEYQKQDIFYHATKMKYTHKIEKMGLIPRTQSKIGYHPERIYLAKSFNAALDILGMLYDHDYSDPNWIIYEVNVSNIPNFKTMVDPNFDGGVYTTQNIPPSALKPVKIFDMSK